MAGVNVGKALANIRWKNATEADRHATGRRLNEGKAAHYGEAGLAALNRMTARRRWWTFSNWLKRQHKRTDSIGELSRRVRAAGDLGWPARGSREDFQAALTLLLGPVEGPRRFKHAWGTWRSGFKKEFGVEPDA